MSLHADIADLLTYSEYERRRWREWFAADPQRLDLPFQPSGRFPTIGVLLDHIFLVERRHLSRLEGGTPAESTGIAPGDLEGLFEFAELVRADLRGFITELDDARANEPITVSVASGTFTMTRRKLLVHLVFHEARHFAQIAFAARQGGHPPPGQHDLFYCPELT